MNALDVLLRDHREQERLLSELENSMDPASRDSLYQQFRKELIKHVNIEEEIFYPRLKQIPELEQVVLEALEEHNICMRLLQELDIKEGDEKIWKAKLSVLHELTQNHIKEEENNLFPKVEELATMDYLRDMGKQMSFQRAVTDPEKVLYPEKTDTK